MAKPAEITPIAPAFATAGGKPRVRNGYTHATLYDGQFDMKVANVKWLHIVSISFPYDNPEEEFKMFNPV
ncbi:MAG: hypothetical protein MZV63_09610 [Marinilabiliales bacterium]|nr:hypothetical protein [Marinilabiliales bacterium]